MYRVLPGEEALITERRHASLLQTTRNRVQSKHLKKPYTVHGVKDSVSREEKSKEENKISLSIQESP